MDSYKMYDDTTPDVLTQIEQGHAAFTEANAPATAAAGPSTPTRPTEGVSQPTPSSDTYMENPMYDETAQEGEDEISSSALTLPERDNSLGTPPRRSPRPRETMPSDATRHLPGHELAAGSHPQPIPEDQAVEGDAVPSQKAMMAEEASVPIILLEPGVEQEMDALASRRQEGYTPRYDGPRWVEQDVSGYSAQSGYKERPTQAAGTGRAAGAAPPTAVVSGYTSGLQGPFLPATAFNAGISPGPSAPRGARMEMLPGTPTIEERMAERREREREQRELLQQQQQQQQASMQPPRAAPRPIVNTTQTFSATPLPPQTAPIVQPQAVPGPTLVAPLATTGVSGPVPGRLGEAPLETPPLLSTPVQPALPPQGPFAVEEPATLPMVMQPVLTDPQQPIYNVGQRFEGPIEGAAELDPTADIELKMMLQRSRQLSTSLPPQQEQGLAAPEEDVVNPAELRLMMQRSRELHTPSPGRSPILLSQEAVMEEEGGNAPSAGVGAPGQAPRPPMQEDLEAPHDMSTMFAASRVLSTPGSDLSDPMTTQAQPTSAQQQGASDLSAMFQRSRTLSQEVVPAPQVGPVLAQTICLYLANSQ